MKDSAGFASAARIARLGHELLHTKTRAEAIEAAVGAVRDILGVESPDAVVFDDAVDGNDASARAGTAFEVRSAGRQDHGRLVLVAAPALVEAASAGVRLVADDLAQALVNTEAAAIAREVTRLREALERRDALVRQAGDALMRDAHEVVRVVAELEQRDALINADLHQALRFQQAMIAPLPAHDRVSMSAIYLPSEVISGDFYDVAFIDESTLRVFIADATGHGVAAGLATMFIKSEYEARKRVSQAPPEVLRTINEQLSSSYRNLELQFTALCMDLNVWTGRLCYASAAHPGPLVLRSGGTDSLPSGGPFVGVTTGVHFPEHEAKLQPGEMLVGFSDGLFDASAPDGSSFGESGVVGTLLGVVQDGAEACPALVRALSSFVGEGGRLPDDVTIVALSMNPS